MTSCSTQGGLPQFNQKWKWYLHVQVSVEGAPTMRSPTQAGNFFVLDGKLVVISDLLSHRNVSLRINDNLLLIANTDHTSVTIGL